MLYYLLIVAGLFFLRFLYTMVYLTKKRLAFYDNPPNPIYYFPVLGAFKRSFDTLKTHGDFYWELKNMAKLYPKA